MSDKLKICQLGMKRIPSREGGIEIVVEELSTRLAKLGYQVTCLNRSGHNINGKEYDEKRMKTYKGIKLMTVPTINKKGLAAFSSSVCGAIVATFGKYDIVHFHAEGPCAMLWLPKLFGKRCIATIHGLDHQREKWGRFASWYIMLGEKIAVKYADEIIVLSESVQKYFEKTYRRETKIVPNGVNKPKRIPSKIIEEKYGLKRDGYILFLGRIVPEKGLRYLVAAFQKVLTDKKLVIVGGSSDTDSFVSELKRLAKNDERIIFTGFEQGTVLDELYTNAYVYTLPSDLEGMPLSLLEAMSYGNCCVVSDIEECVSVVENNAIIFKKSNVKDLVKKLQYVCDNEGTVKQIREKSSNFICEKYNWDDVVQKTLELYRGE